MDALEVIRPELLELEFPELIRRVGLDLAALAVEPDTGSTLAVDYEINPGDFVRFAQQDLAEGCLRGFINALSNAKRAIDCQVQKVFDCLGLRPKRNFPAKMELLSSVGILAPRIVGKVIRTRNYLEHEYVKPQQEQVEDAVDIATLFVAVLDRAMSFFPERYDIGNYLDGFEEVPGIPFFHRGISIMFVPEGPKYELYGYVYELDTQRKKKTTTFWAHSTLIPSDDWYEDLIKLSYHIDKDKDPEDEVRQFLHLVAAS
jgi:hypothetical protein